MNEPFEPELPLRGEEEPAAVADELHRLTNDALAERGGIASKRLLGQLFERELDELATPEGSSVFSEQRSGRSEEDKKKREEKAMLGAVGKAAAENIRGQGLSVVRILNDGETAGGGGYVMRCRDREHREFEARFGLELAERLVAAGGTSNLVERMGLAVAREILSERDRYFRRMATAPVTEIRSEEVQHVGA